jgi:salicylate hydroxylase
LIAYLNLPGIKSLAREVVEPHIDHEPSFSGFAAYRATVDVEKMRADPGLASLLEKPSINLW